MISMFACVAVQLYAGGHPPKIEGTAIKHHKAPCVLSYPPISYPTAENEEAAMIAWSLMDEDDPYFYAPQIYERIDRDLELIRTFEPSLADQYYQLGWFTDGITVSLELGADLSEYECLKKKFQVVEEKDNTILPDTDWRTLFLPGDINIYAVIAEFEELDSVIWGSVSGGYGGLNNYWVPNPTRSGVWRWAVDDGFWDCYDGCDCHYLYQFETTADGTVTLLSYEEVGWSWCEFE